MERKVTLGWPLPQARTLQAGGSCLGFAASCREAGKLARPMGPAVCKSCHDETLERPSTFTPSHRQRPDPARPQCHLVSTLSSAPRRRRSLTLTATSTSTRRV